jgi:hypothetical protein
MGRLDALGFFLAAVLDQRVDGDDRQLVVGRQRE